MRTRAVVVGTVATQKSAQMGFADNHDVVEALAANRTDHPLDEGILPRGAWSGKDLVDPHALDAPHGRSELYRPGTPRGVAERCRLPVSRGAAANDVNMLVCTGGRQRSEAEFRELYAAQDSA